MPLWTFPLRRLASRCSDKPRSCRTRTYVQWLHAHKLRNYSTALAESRHDDEHEPLSTNHGGTRTWPQLVGTAPSRKEVQIGVVGQENRPADASHTPQRGSTTTARSSKAWFPIRQRKKTVKRTPITTSSASRLSNSRARQTFQSKRRRTLARRLRSIAASRARLTAIALLEQRYPVGTEKDRGKLHRFLKHTVNIPVLDVRAFESVEEVLHLLDLGHDNLTRDSIKTWRYIGTEWSTLWAEVALWIIAYQPKRMVEYLLATHVEPYVRPGYVSTALLLLMRRCSKIAEPQRSRQIERVADVVCVLADREGETRQSLTKSFIHELVQHCTDEKVHQIYRAVKEHGVRVTHDSHLRFATHFAKINRFEMALSALADAKDAGADINGYPFRSNCSTLLRRSSLEPDGLRVCLRVVSELVEMGVQLDNRICNIIMLNAVEAGDMKTAFSVYHSLREHGLRPDEHTFSVLLQGCRLNIDDVGMLNDIIRDAIASVNVRKNEVVATQILHCLALHHSKNNPENALHILTEAYAQLFDLGPLRPLGLPLPKVSERRMSAEELMPPTSHAIGFMIGASTQHILAHGGKPKEILPIYERWREQVETGSTLLASLATTDHIANTFLIAFIRYHYSLVQAARVVRDMQRSLPAAAGVEQLKPTVQTWSIFLHGFARHGKNELAEQVLSHMRSKGIEPNLVTWNTLSTGYARAQDMDGTLHALRRSEQAGLVWDAWTYGGLSAFRERQRLQDELQKGRVAKSLDFTADLKEGIGERLENADVVRDTSDVAPTRSDALHKPARGVQDQAYGDSAGELAESDVGCVAEGQYVPFWKEP